MRPNFYYKSILCFWVIGMGIFQTVYSSPVMNDIDVRALALGNIKALSRETANPAYLPFKERKEIGASVYDRFRIKELSTMRVYALIPNQTIDAGFLFSTYGYDEYRLIQGQAGLAKKLSPGFSIGVNLTYLREHSILESESKHGLSAGVGLYYAINESLETAFTVENLLHTHSLLPTLGNAGMLYHLLPDCSVLIEAASDFGKYFDVKAGIEYEISEPFTVRAGFSIQPKTPSIGFAYTGTQWKTEVAFLLHPVLGVSSAIGMAYFF
jgi:hypothetical protein